MWSQMKKSYVNVVSNEWSETSWSQLSAHRFIHFVNNCTPIFTKNCVEPFSVCPIGCRNVSISGVPSSLLLFAVVSFNVWTPPLRLSFLAL